MFIRTVDDGLERLLRSELPLPTGVGDVSFDAPTGTWSAALSRLTVNLYLYDVSRSPHPARALTQRVGPDNAVQRRAPQPMIQLGYLVSAWAGSPRDEHQLLGEVVSLISSRQSLPPDMLTPEPSSSVLFAFGDDSRNHTREIWSSLGGNLKASFTLQVSVAADSFDWAETAPPVERIEALASPRVVPSRVAPPGSALSGAAPARTIPSAPSAPSASSPPSTARPA